MKVWIWIIFVLLVIGLGIGGYVFMHSKEPMIKKDGSVDYYKKDFTYERTLFGWRVYTGDRCNGNELQEQIVNKDSNVVGRYYVSFESFNCPNGCQDGACVR